MDIEEQGTQGAKVDKPESEGIVQTPGDRRHRTRRRGFVKEDPIGWLLALVVPAGVYYYLNSVGLPHNTSLFLSIVSVSLVMWVFSLVADFVPALFAMLVILLFGLAPTDLVLSGFSSFGFMLTFSVLGLGVVVTSSGLTYRYTLWLLSHLPKHTFWYQVALFFTGLLFTPIVPSTPGRASITAPILLDIVDGLDKDTKQKSAEMLYTSGRDGFSFLGALFLTSAPINLVIFGMLPLQDQRAYQFMKWLYAASITGAVMLVLYFVLSAIFFRAYGKVEISRKSMQERLAGLGPMSWQEWLALAGIIVLAAGIITASIHKIRIPFIAFSVLFSLLFLGVLSREDFVSKIDWAFLFLLGALIGVLATMNYLGIDKLLMKKLAWLGDYMRHDFNTFVVMLCGAIVLIRLLVPLNSAVLIFSAALLPLATASGVSPWLMGFIILLISETAFYPYQTPYIQHFRNLLGDALPVREGRIRAFRGLLLLVKIAAIYASIPFWVKIGVL